MIRTPKSIRSVELGLLPSDIPYRVEVVVYLGLLTKGFSKVAYVRIGELKISAIVN